MGIKEEGKKFEISENSETDPNQQCLQHIHAEASGTGRPQAPPGALPATDASSPQATPALQELSTEVARSTDEIQVRIPWFSTQLPKKREKQTAAQWTKGPQRYGEASGLVRPVLSWLAARGSGVAGGRALRVLPLPGGSAHSLPLGVLQAQMN